MFVFSNPIVGPLKMLEAKTVKQLLKLTNHNNNNYNGTEMTSVAFHTGTHCF